MRLNALVKKIILHSKDTYAICLKDNVKKFEVCGIKYDIAVEPER